MFNEMMYVDAPWFRVEEDCSCEVWDVVLLGWATGWVPRVPSWRIFIV